jgi:hypothetical protein
MTIETWDAPLSRLMHERLAEIDQELADATLEQHELMAYIGEVAMLLTANHQLIMTLEAETK